MIMHRNAPLPVLMYHGLHADADASGRFDPVYSVRPAEFARQLDWLLASGHRTILPGRHDADATCRRPLLVTFDDGDVSNIEVALPLLSERGMVAEFFITSDFVGQPGMLSAADVRALADAGMGIGAHGCSHGFLEDLDMDALDAELRDSGAYLARLVGRDIVSLALPGGRGGGREYRAALAQGYRHLFGSVPGCNAGIGDDWWQRIPVRRNTSLAEFRSLVRWRGLRPRLERARFLALRLPKQLLGNAGYARLRERLL